MALIQVTVHVEDQSNDPIENVRYAIQDENQTILYGNGLTDVGGDSTPVALEESTDYAVLLSKPWVIFAVPEIISVPAGPDPFSVTLWGMSTPLQPPADPTLCRVGGYLIDIDGEDLAEVNIKVSNLYRYSVQSAGRTVLGSEKGTTTADDGYFQIDLVRGLVVRLSIQDTGLNVQFVVPDQGTATLEEVLALAEDEIPLAALG